MMSDDIFGRLLVARCPDGLRDGVDQVVCSSKIGSCSLQEKQMRARSVEALIRRRNGNGDRLPQAPGIRLAAPQERQPRFLERGQVRWPTTKGLRDAWLRPDKALGELPARAN
jgi:hypothetical protein